VKLRGKLVLSCAVAIAATFAALSLYDAKARHDAATDLMVEIVGRQLDTLQARCESDPRAFGGPLHRPQRRGPPPAPPHDGPPHDGPPHDGPPHDGPPRDDPPSRPREDGRQARPIEVHAYDASLASTTDAPPLPRALVDAANAEGIARATMSWRDDEVAAVFRTSSDTPACAYLYARGSTGDWGAVVPEGRLWLLPAVVVLAATLLVAGPLVGRIRRLTHAIERSASAGYTLDVDASGSDEVGELARAFGAASRRIRDELREREIRERALREFVANTTHDLMIPLTVLQGHLSALREADPAVTRAARHEAHYLASLVHNLAAAAKLDVPEPVAHRARVDLRDVVMRVAARHRPIAATSDIELAEAVPDAPVLALADVTLVEQAVSNLAYNAVRYNHRGGHVAVILEVMGDRFSLRVLDDGPGIEPADLAALAARGARSDAARARAPEGQGLGLHIAFRVAALHGYALALGPNEGGGLEATLQGPLAAPD
jgi:signal transduction histidine kinase